MTKRFLTEEEKKLWEDMNQDTKILKARKITPQNSKPKASKEVLELTSEPQSIEIPVPNIPQTTQHSSDIDTIDRRTARKLRTQALKIDGRLDLHGLYQDEAFTQLKRFMDTAYGRGHKVILVITGKGKSSDAPGVLRQNVPTWLKNKQTFPYVSSVSTAQPRDGGSGAYYVFLKRRV